MHRRRMRHLRSYTIGRGCSSNARGSIWRLLLLMGIGLRERVPRRMTGLIRRHQVVGRRLRLGLPVDRTVGTPVDRAVSILGVPVLEVVLVSTETPAQVCYTCQQHGYISRDCPQKTSSPKASKELLHHLVQWCWGQRAPTWGLVICPHSSWRSC